MFVVGNNLPRVIADSWSPASSLGNETMSVQSAPIADVKDRASELRAFYDFVGEKLRLSESRLTPESVFDEWQSLHSEHDQDEFIDDQDDYEAIKESLDAMHAGEPAKSVEEFERDFRERHGLPPRS